MAFISDGGFCLDQGHLRISFAERKGWVTQEAYGNVETPPMISLGDPKSGPVISLSLHPGGPGPAYRTPTHYHGTDQFRMILKGRAERAISRLKLEARQFAFQEAGMPYREGFGGDDVVWAMLIRGDRRGSAAAAPAADSSERTAEPAPAMASENPGGPAGIPSVATTFGACRNGFLLGSLDMKDGWRGLGEGVQVAASMWGDRASGPLMLMIKGEPGATVIPAFTSATETMCVLAAGSCRIGGAKYELGDLRIQAADAQQEEVTAGPEGVELILLVADRRALPKVAAADARWRAGLDNLVADLVSVLASRRSAGSDAEGQVG